MQVDHADAAVTRSGYRSEIDGLRAVAVVAVIINHLDARLLPSGFLGVDVFFAISGYVITGSLWRSEFRSLGDLLKTFYSRRIRRLLPALLLCTLVTGFAVAIVAVNPDPSLKVGLAALFGLSNLRLLGWATDYFAEPAALNTFTHTWSLGVEEQFYVVYPLLIWFLLVRSGKPSARRTFALVVSALSAASLTAFLLLGGPGSPISFFLMPTRFWELGTGCLLFIVTEGRARETVRLSLWRDFSAIAALAMVLLVFFGGPSLASVWTIVAVAATAALIASIRPATVPYRLLNSRLATSIGLLSYSLYLWHWSVFSISRWTIGISPATTPIQLVLIALLGWASYRFVERPLRAATWAPTRERTLFYGAAASAFAALVMVAVRIPLQGPLQAVGNRIVPLAYAEPGVLQKFLPCHFPASIDLAYERCMARPSPSDTMIFVIGDSHATNHVPSLEKAVSSSPAWHVAYLVEHGYVNEISGVESCLGYDACIPDGYRRLLGFLSTSLRPSDIVVFSWSRDRVTIDGSLPRRPNETALARLAIKLGELRDAVVRKGATLILVDDTPKLCDHVFYMVDILRQGRLDRCSISVTDSRKDREGLSHVYRTIAGPHVVVFDPHDALCANGRCGMTLPGSALLLYGDAGGHFTPRSSLELAGEWREYLAATGYLGVHPVPASASSLASHRPSRTPLP